MRITGSAACEIRVQAEVLNHAMHGQHQGLCRGAICLLQEARPPQLKLSAS